MSMMFVPFCGSSRSSLLASQVQVLTPFPLYQTTEGTLSAILLTKEPGQLSSGVCLHPLPSCKSHNSHTKVLLLCSMLTLILSFFFHRPTFRHYRMLSIFGILTTTYIAWYMTITAAVQGPSEDTTYSAPSSFEQFMLGIVALLFTYGGHTSNIEVADVMDNPASYDRSYFWSYLYVFTLTMPNAVAAYHTFGDLCLYNSNSIALYPKTVARDIGLAFMVVHEAVAFGLFAGP
jgi:hypothetical protein